MYSGKEENIFQSEDRLKNIYDNNIISPSALYVFKDASVLCMPFAELGTYVRTQVEVEVQVQVQLRLK